MNEWLWRTATCAVLLGGVPALGQSGTSLDARVQAPVLGAPERGSLAGQFAATSFGVGDVSRGVFRLPWADALPSERGAPGVSVLPAYSPESGLSEWGLGWNVGLSLTRWRETGDLDYATDELTGPFGRLVAGTDGAWYPVGLAQKVRVTAVTDGWVAHLPDGSRWTFGGVSRVVTSRGTYAWYLTEVTTPTGRKTRLEYEANASGRLFVKALHHGGVGNAFQHRVDFEYEAVPRPTTDLRSGQALVLDKRVKAVVALSRDTGTSLFVERWRENLAYEEEAQGPAYYLTQAQRVYASGESAPMVRYGYEPLGTHLAQLQAVSAPKLDAVVAERGVDAMRATRSALLDVNHDGRMDFESASDNTLFVQEDGGFRAEPLPAAPPGVSSLCRRSATGSTVPRMLVQMRATDLEYQVVGVQADNLGNQTTVAVCNREGVPYTTLTLAANWTLGGNVRLADVNRDRQPDLVKVSAGRYTIHPNTSTAQGFSFGAAVTGTLSPSVAPNTTWLQDVNGDGLADIVVRGSASLLVWLGKGSYGFEQTARTFTFRTPQGAAYSSLTNYQLHFADANKDGLVDALLTRISSPGTLLLINTGSAFQEVAVPTLNAMVGTPVVADFAGTGEVEVLFTDAGPPRSVGMTAPRVALLRSADDGRGNLLRFEYERSAAVQGGHARQVVLGALEVRSSGLETVRYTYGYSEPKVHSVGRYLVGFGGVTRTGPGLVEDARFLNGDYYSGLPASSTQHDTQSPGVHGYTYQTYEDAVFQGLPWKRLEETGNGWAQADGLAVGEWTKYVRYEAEVCPAEVTQHTAHGTLKTETWRASPSGLGVSLHCLQARTLLTGMRPDSTVDFKYEARLTRNSAGQVEKVEDVSADGDVLTVQQAVYGANALIQSVTEPGRGTTTFEWEPGTLQLSRVVSPDGVVMEAGDVHPTTGAIQQLSTLRGSRSYSQYFRYDGQERLAKRWDDLGGASEVNPQLLLAYRYATDTRPGSFSTSALVDSLTGSTRAAVEWQTATGESLGIASRIPQGWAVKSLSTRNPLLLEKKTHVRPALGASVDPQGLDYATLLAGTDVVSTLRSSGLGFDSSAISRLHADVQRQVASQVQLVDGLLMQEAVENGADAIHLFMDTQKRTVAYEDEAGTRYTYRYDSLGRLRGVGLQDGKNHGVHFDGHGRVSRVDVDGTASVAYAYQPGTSLLARKTFLSTAGIPLRTEDYGYDAIGRKVLDVHTDLSSEESLSYQYFHDGATPTSPADADSVGLLTAVRGPGYLKQFEYRVDGKPTRSTLRFDGWRTVETLLDYREDGSVRSESACVRLSDGTSQGCTVLANTLDVHGRTASLSLNAAPLAALAYDAEGLLAGASLTGGRWASFTHDSLTRAVVGFSQGGPGLQSSTSWRYGPRGLVTSETFQVGSQSLTRVHDYSPQRFLTSSTDAQSSYAYAYDAMGLPSRIEENGVARTFKGRSGALDAGDDVYTFDALGRALTRGDLSFNYGPHGQLALATRGTEAWQYLYDEAGLRLAKLHNGVFQAGYLGEGAYLDGTGLTRPFKVGDRLLGVIQGGVLYPLAADRRGTVLSDKDGTPRFASPYGVRTTPTDTAAALDFVERSYDADLGLVRMGVRDYDPALNRFLSPDPLYLESMEKCAEKPVECNLYGYARNAPLDFIDPSGLDTLLLHGGGVLGMASGVDELKATAEGLFPSVHAVAPDGIHDKAGVPLKDDPGPATQLAATYFHVNPSEMNLIGYSQGGDAAIMAVASGGPLNGGKWDNVIILGARVDRLIANIEAASANTEHLVIISLWDDKYFWEDTVELFGDRRMETLETGIIAKYGSMEAFSAKFPNVTIGSAEGGHMGAGNRDKSQTAVTKGVEASRSKTGQHTIEKPKPEEEKE
ncbi:RHS repeat-associated core domain-containing protein [Pyxidicoccus xibeiensis]|uniref:RHS repeat-associated core domain-containing protein n=1 Tax=Pyxidicoccus xibeiensis TaxID=2906759 RepID=UPI0020A7B2E8|nr:RHS repeat-associated core domain-containing protein [Pyxidicoccus xibeiensis]MCP3143031.1 FG-GAP-like repeat-containing protein [Pyxidicoccus xibeiensis]